MNIARNMEAIFLVTLALTCATAYAASPVQRTDATPAVVATNSSEMTVITVTAKRLTAAQKAQLGA